MKTLDELLSFIEQTKTVKQYIFHFSGVQEKVKLSPGIYSFECWGASGINFTSSKVSFPGGKGAYVFGKIRIDSPRVLFISVGECPKKNTENIFGGGGAGEFPGGGGSDIRLIPGDSFESLKSRIIVAAGGGGSDSLEEAGSGGGINGENSKNRFSKGANQTSAGTGFYPGEFGKGGRKLIMPADGNGGGGGRSGKAVNNYVGSGGSSFISGHEGCDALSFEAKTESRFHAGNPWHYSGFVFFDTYMIDGGQIMPDIEGGSKIGNIGYGAIRIKKLSTIFVHYFSFQTNQTFNWIFPSLFAIIIS